MAQRMTRKQLLKTDEVAEVAVEAGQWFEEHWRMLAAAGAAAAVVVAAVFGWMWFAEQNREKARVMVDTGLEKYAAAEAVGFADTAALEAALQAFEGAGQKAGSAAPGDVARLYQGLTLYRLGRTEEAIAQLEPWAGRLDDAPTLAGTAVSVLTQAWAESGQAERAVTLLEEVSRKGLPGLPPDQALLHLSRIHELAGSPEESRQALQRILDEFPQSAASGEARQKIAP